MKSKIVSASDLLKKALPDRHISPESVDAFREQFRRFQKQAEDAGWTPEYVASLDKKGDAK